MNMTSSLGSSLRQALRPSKLPLINGILSLMSIMILASCGQEISVSGNIEECPKIFPDYAGVTIPANIAPLNFSYLGDEPAVLIVNGNSGERQIKGRKGLFSFPTRYWKKLMETGKGSDVKLTVAVRRDGKWMAFKPFILSVSADVIDPYLSYRLIPPGYEAWKKMGIYQRNLETYSQTPIIENSLTGGNCVNCHTYCQRDPSRMLFHARADYGGTAMIIDGNVEKLNTKTDSTISALVYPYWHPSGKYVAFSVNTTSQNFFSHNPNRIEVYDSASDIVVYDVDRHEISWSPLTRSKDSFETFPAFSPDGRSLYFCSAKAVSPMPQEYSKVKYSLCRIAFNQEDASFGDSVDTLYNGAANGKSVSFPRISPDGRFLVFTLQEYGNFSIWHKDADLWLMNMSTGETRPLEAANSEDVDSYHSWSGNSRWLVFSSRRIDGLYTRPFICHIDENGQASKPFLLPQRNPLEYYADQMVSYNLPELMEHKVTVSRHKIANTLRNTSGTDITVKAK